MTMRKGTILCITLLVLSANVSPAAVVILDPIDRNVANGISGLEVDGVLLDVDFTRAGESFNTIFGTGDPPGVVPYFYNDRDGAEAARDAIGRVLSTSPVQFAGDAAFFVPSVQVPFRAPDPTYNPELTFGLQFYPLTSGIVGTSFISRDASVLAIALFTARPAAAVPEVGGAATWMVGIWVVSLGICLHRRQGKCLAGSA
jgi:hypothetical protein